MTAGLRTVLLQLAAFITICVLGIFALLAVFAQLRFGDQNTYRAVFSDVSGLREGNFVRIAGVEVGKIKTIHIDASNNADITFSADRSVLLTEGTRAVVRYENLIGGRFLELAEGPGGMRALAPGGTIPIDRTQPALDLDALIGGFRPLLRALDPQQVNTVTAQLIAVLQGQGGTIASMLQRISQLTSTLADRDQLIGDLITNLNTVLGTVGDQNKHFDSAVDSLAQISHELQARRDQVANGLAYTNAAAASIADLLQQARQPLSDTVTQADRTAQTVLNDRDYFDHTLATLPQAYQILGRQGLWGDFFSFYLCDLLLKVNGKGGQPVYIQLAQQTTGRCATK